MTPAESLHLAACHALDLDPEARGTQAQVARAVGADPTAYNQAVLGRRGITLDLLAEWAGRLGLSTVREASGAVRFEVADG